MAAMAAAPATRMVQAATDNSTVSLEPGSSMLSMLSVHFGLFYPAKAEVADLASALARILPAFKVLSGRYFKTETGLAILCNGAGVPLTHVVREEPAPSLLGPLSAEHFDELKDVVPPEGTAEGAPLRLRVTDFADGQLVAVSMNHGLCDARGIGAWLTAWAAAYRGEDRDLRVSHDRLSAVIPSPAWGQPPLTATEGVPECWRQLHHPPEACPEAKGGPMVSPVFATVVMSAGTCAALKERSNAASGGDVSVSTNDVLCAELATCLAAGEASVPVNMLLEYRNLVGKPHLFSNVWCTIELLVTSSPAGAGDIRRLLPHAQSRDFVEWHLGQSMGGYNMAWKPRLTMNTWSKAFELQKLAFRGPALDVSLGMQMLEARAAMMIPGGSAYCIALPRSDGGVKAQLFMPEEATQRLDGVHIHGPAA